MVSGFYNIEDVAVKDFATINPTGGTKGVRWTILPQDDLPNQAWQDFSLYGTLGNNEHFYSFNNIIQIISALDDDTAIDSVVDDFLLNPDPGDIHSPPNLIGKKLGVWLMEDDIYLTLIFTEWGQGGGGAVAYTRSTPANN